MRILLTGITGYLGSHLASALIADGCTVIGLKRRTSSLRRLESFLPKLNLRDVEEANFPALFTEYGRIDAVIHTATCYGRNGEGASHMADANLAFPIKLLEVAEAFGVGLFMNTDTVLDKILNSYALSKSQFAEWGQYFSRQRKIRFLNLKLEHFYGAGDDDTKFTTQVIKSCLMNIPELKLTLGQQRRDFVHIEDVVTAYRQLLSKSIELELGFFEFGIGTGNAVSIREFANTVHRLAASKTRLMFGAIPNREYEIMHSEADIAAIRAQGWTCRYDLEAGLKQVINAESSNSQHNFK